MTEPDRRCRLCTTNDVDALADEIAAEMWSSYGRDPRDPPWEGAGSYWQAAITAHAHAMIRVVRRSHDHD